MWGATIALKATGLKESAMLTEDENILDIKFAVQYRLSDAMCVLFESKNLNDAVVQAAETAVREVWQDEMDAALSEERDQIALRVRDLMQTILDRYKVGVEIVGINLQQGGVRPPLSRHSRPLMMCSRRVKNVSVPRTRLRPMPMTWCRVRWALHPASKKRRCLQGPCGCASPG